MNTPTQKQSETLEPCPFCEGEELSDGFSAPPYQAIVQCHSCGGIMVSDESEEACRDAWNTRPAKAVQGDLDALKGALLLEFKDQIEMDMRIVNPERRTPTKKGMKTGVLICKVVDRVAAALTPESEGIAGKGDTISLAKSISDQCMPIPQSWKDEQSSLNEAARIMKATLARPQEIDVESLVNEVTDKICANPEHSKTGMRLVVSGIVQSAIDHLHSSGYLSAQSQATQDKK